jgi:hypothetical protein
MAKKKKDGKDIGSGAPHGNVSEDTAVHFANANKDVLITGDLDTFDLKSWGNGGTHGPAEAYLIGGTVDGNAPFNIYDVKDTKGLMNSFNSSDELQNGENGKLS